MQHLSRNRHAPDFKASFFGCIKQKYLAWHDDLLEVKLTAANAFHNHHATGVVLVNAFDHDVFTGGQPIWDLQNKASVRLITKKLEFRFCLDRKRPQFLFRYSFILLAIFQTQGFEDLRGLESPTHAWKY